MKTFQWPLRVFVFIALIQLVSCTKTADTVRNDSVNLETSSDATLASEFSTCKLRRIYHEFEDLGSLSNGLFTYNAAGNPYTLIYTHPDQNPPDYFFYYDKKNRLTKLIRTFEEGVSAGEYHIEHRYGYNDSNVAIVDSLFSQWQSLDITLRSITHFTYDSQGRIIKETIKDLKTGTTRNPTYTYDNRGNLAVPGWKSSGYDNKVSIFRAHPLFQFIHRNYSRNNALPEAKYNSKGLPLAVKNLNDSFFDAILSTSNNTLHPAGGIVRAVYDCQ
jgi:hypothetical protein